MKFKKLIIVTLVLIPLLFLSNSAYAGWEQGKILKATQTNDGQVIIKIWRDSTSSTLNALVLESLSQTSKNAILAIALTAVAMDAPIDAFFDWGTGRYTQLAIISPTTP